VRYSKILSNDRNGGLRLSHPIAYTNRADRQWEFVGSGGAHSTARAVRILPVPDRCRVASSLYIGRAFCHGDGAPRQKARISPQGDSELGAAIRDMVQYSARAKWFSAQAFINSGRPASEETLPVASRRCRSTLPSD